MKKREMVELAKATAVRLAAMSPRSSAVRGGSERVRIHRYCYGAACALGMLVIAADRDDDLDPEAFMASIISAAIDYDGDNSELEVIGDGES